MNEFERADTQRNLMGPVVVKVELAPGPVAPDFADEVTVERAMCWKHGGYYIRDDSVHVRLPMYSADCFHCSMGGAR